MGWDHLHMRGEYPYCFTPNLLNVGSPPHAWRIPYHSASSQAIARITSTCVENTKKTSMYIEFDKDHLHMRGEYNSEGSPQLWPRGSPPHAWRIRFCRCWVFAKVGITSTCVENTVNKSLYNAKWKYANTIFSSLWSYYQVYQFLLNRQYPLDIISK